jgi:hypothetical protein
MVEAKGLKGVGVGSLLVTSLQSVATDRKASKMRLTNTWRLADPAGIIAVAAGYVVCQGIA